MAAYAKAQPLLKNLTYDPTAVYDDAWLKDTLYDSAVGAALGGLGGGVDVKSEQQKTTSDLEVEWMFEKLPELVSKPDLVEAGGLGRGKKNAGKRAVIFSKEFPGGTVVTVQFDNKGRRTMEITTLYARKKGTISKPYASVPTETSAGRPKRLESVPFEDSIS